MRCLIRPAARLASRVRAALAWMYCISISFESRPHPEPCMRVAVRDVCCASRLSSFRQTSGGAQCRPFRDCKECPTAKAPDGPGAPGRRETRNALKSPRHCRCAACAACAADVCSLRALQYCIGRTRARAPLCMRLPSVQVGGNHPDTAARSVPAPSRRARTQARLLARGCGALGCRLLSNPAIQKPVRAKPEQQAPGGRCA